MGRGKEKLFFHFRIYLRKLDEHIERTTMAYNRQQALLQLNIYLSLSFKQRLSSVDYDILEEWVRSVPDAIVSAYPSSSPDTAKKKEESGQIRFFPELPRVWVD